MIAGMRTVVLALSLAGCGRVNFDATGDAGIVDPPLPDAATFTAPCDVATLVGTGDVATPFGVAAEANLYRATWLDSSKVVHVLGVERTGDAIAVNERTFGASAFLPQPAGADVELLAGRTVSIMWGTSQTTVRQLIGSQLGTGRSTAYGALITDLGRNGTQMFMLLPGGDLRVQTVDPTMLTYGSSSLVDMQMTEQQQVIGIRDGAMLVAARPNADDCTAWTFSGTLVERGLGNVPADMNSCEEVAAAHASIPDQRALAYTYLAATPLIRAQSISELAAPGVPVTLTAGTEPRIASGGFHFRIAFRTTSGVVRVAKLSPDLAVVSDELLHPTAVGRFALASNDGEVLAVYATTTTPNEIWIKRLCGT